jgi:hypothetical protein
MRSFPANSASISAAWRIRAALRNKTPDEFSGEMLRIGG